MHNVRLRRKIAALVFGLVLLAPGAWATEPRGAAGSATPDSLEFLVTLWSRLAALWEEAGCGIDPSGRCTPDQGEDSGSTTNSDAGCGLDPSGRCQPGT